MGWITIRGVQCVRVCRCLRKIVQTPYLPLRSVQFKIVSTRSGWSAIHSSSQNIPQCCSWDSFGVGLTEDGSVSPFKTDRRPLLFCVPLISSRQPVVWCPWLCAQGNAWSSSTLLVFETHVIYDICFCFLFVCCCFCLFFVCLLLLFWGVVLIY